MTGQDDRVSVIVPLHDKGPYVSRAIRSVLRQTLQDFEIIVVDDHSTDDGPRIVRDIGDPRVTIVSNPESGAASTRNLGAFSARRDLIAFLDADDEWDPAHLETLVSLRKRFPEAGAWVTAYRMVVPGNAVRDPAYHGIPPAPWEGLIPDYVRSAVFGDFPFVTICVGISRDLFTGMGGFLPHLTWNEDLELWLRVALKYPVAFSWRGPGLWHLEAANRVSNSLSYRDIERRGEFVERAADAIRSPDTPSRHLPCLKEYIAKFELARALWIIEAGHPGEARRILKAQQTALFPKKRRQYLLLSFVPAPLFRGLWRLYRGIHEHVKGEQYNENPWLR